MNWVWFVKYNKKRASVYYHYYKSKSKKENHLNINIDGLEFKMTFTHPYYHLFARRLQQGLHEKNSLIAWKRQAETKPEVVLDLGGYVGTYGLIAAKANPHSKVFIFEPDTTNFKQISENIKANNLHNAVVLQKAVSDVAGRVSFKNYPGSEAGSISQDTGDSSVECTTIAAWMEETKLTPTLIKMDVEGAEYKALSGGKKFLKESKDLRIILEVHYDLLKKFGDSQEKLWGLLDELSYDHFYLDTNEWNDHYWIYKKA